MLNALNTIHSQSRLAAKQVDQCLEKTEEAPVSKALIGGQECQLPLPEGRGL